MKTILGLAIAGALLSAGAANATVIADPSTGVGDLILFVQDTVTKQTYARDTGITLDSLFSKATITANQPYSGTVNLNNLSIPSLGPDANLTQFITSAGAHTLQWAVEAANWTGASGAQQRPVAHMRVLTTAGVSDPTLVTAAGLSTQMTNFKTDVQNLNGFGQIGATGSTLETGVVATSGDGVWGTGAGVNGNQNWYGATPDTTGVLTGANQSFYGLTGNGSGGGRVQSYLLGTLTLTANGTLQSVGAAPVPLPAAVWLLGSGILGLFGVGRRRTATA